jgi:hypothetical protein
VVIWGSVNWCRDWDAMRDRAPQAIARRQAAPPSKREVDWDDDVINQAQRRLFSRHR